jgi:hypothetical protein
MSELREKFEAWLRQGWRAPSVPIRLRGPEVEYWNAFERYMWKGFQAAYEATREDLAKVQASIERGLEQSATGDVHDLGSFAEESEAPFEHGEVVYWSAFRRQVQYQGPFKGPEDFQPMSVVLDGHTLKTAITAELSKLNPADTPTPSANGEEAP